MTAKPNEEPEFISQCGDPMTPEQRIEWVRARNAEAEAQGCTFGRASIHEAIPHLVLFEGWKVPPADQGEQRWQLTASAA